MHQRSFNITSPTTTFILFFNAFPTQYRTSSSGYFFDEVQECSTPEAVAQQLQFLNDSMTSSTAEYNIVLAHHPAISTCGPSYFQTSQAPATADGWTPLSNLVLQYSPVAYFNGRVAAHFMI